MKFAHIADCHVGGWRDPKLTELSIVAFEQALQRCHEERVDFILIAGDLFNTALPGIDAIKRVAKALRKLRQAHIPIYFIAGSHDYSPSGKTMLDVLESAGLAKNAARAQEIDGKLHLKFTTDPKTGVKMTGILGRMGSLDKEYYARIDRESLEKESGYKIFLFHALLEELKPSALKDVEGHALSLLPKGFDYYAGGHPHFVYSKVMGSGYGRVAYTGPLFPNSFSELEELGKGGFFIIDDGESKRIDIELKKVHTLLIDASNKTPEQVSEAIKSELEKIELEDTIITLRVEGLLESGKPSQIDWRGIASFADKKHCFSLLKNTAALQSPEFEEVKVQRSEVGDIERTLIAEHIKDDKVRGIEGTKLASALLDRLDAQKEEGERQIDFEARLLSELEELFTNESPSQ